MDNQKLSCVHNLAVLLANTYSTQAETNENKWRKSHLHSLIIAGHLALCLECSRNSKDIG